MAETDTKQVHVILRGEQVRELQILREFTGIANDNDLFRYLLRWGVRELPPESRERLERQVPLCSSIS